MATLVFFFFSLFLTANSQLSPSFYELTCPEALTTIKTAISPFILYEPRMAASLIRLLFHDCFVQGCDASILLDNSFSIKSEKDALPNNNSVRGYEVIDAAKFELEKICPGVVSCADVIATATRDATELIGGPWWPVKLGRRDSTTANLGLANTVLPGPRSQLDSLISIFNANGLSAREMVALSGAHTVGQARCFLFKDRIYMNGSDIDEAFASTLRQGCPVSGNSNPAPLDFVTPNTFDNKYFKNLMQKKGLLESDQVLFSGGSTDNIVREYSENSSLFMFEFANAMVKLSEINPLTGEAGVVRRVCGALP